MSSPGTGTMPLPSLPVDSATSCSTQSPKEATDAGSTKVSLSWPASVASPIRAPSHAPGFSNAGTALQPSAISSAEKSRSSRSAPIRAAGTRPNSDSAEYRPPRSGGFWNTCRNPLARASSSRGVPGSVIAMKFEPRPSSFAEKYSNCDSVSSVVPDLLATMKSVWSRSSDASTRAIVAGCVVSRTVSSTAPGAVPP